MARGLFLVFKFDDDQDITEDAELCALIHAKFASGNFEVRKEPRIEKNYLSLAINTSHCFHVGALNPGLFTGHGRDGFLRHDKLIAEVLCFVRGKVLNLGKGVHWGEPMPFETIEIFRGGAVVMNY